MERRQACSLDTAWALESWAVYRVLGWFTRWGTGEAIAESEKLSGGWGAEENVKDKDFQRASVIYFSIPGHDLIAIYSSYLCPIARIVIIVLPCVMSWTRGSMPQASEPELGICQLLLLFIQNCVYMAQRNWITRSGFPYDICRRWTIVSLSISTIPCLIPKP